MADHRSEHGFALVAVMGIVALVTAVAIGGYFLSLQALNESKRVSGESKAFQVAASGLDRELAVFNPATMVGGVYSNAYHTPDGTYTVIAEASPNNPWEYIMTSTGESAGTTESVTQRFFYINLWDMNIGDGDSAGLGGGSGWNGNASIDGPLYVRGNMDWSSSALYETGPLFIKDGALNVTGSGTIGAAEPIYLFATQGLTGNKAATNVYLAGPVSSSVPDIELPWVDDEYLDAALQKAKDESIDNNMGYASRTTTNSEALVTGNEGMYTGVPPATGASSWYKFIGSDAGRDAANAGTHDLTIGAASFGSWEGNGYPLASGTHDDFAYDALNGTLYVEGTVFIDGDLYFTSDVEHYVGNGTLVVNGDVWIGDAITVADFTPLNGDLSAGECVGMVATGDIYINGSMRGAIFCNGTFILHSPGTWYNGSVLCGEISGDSPGIMLTTNPLLKTTLPESMPGAGGGIVFPGAWSRS